MQATLPFQETVLPKLCLRTPIPEIAIAAQYLDAAVSAHLVGQPEQAAELIRRADMPEIRAWTESLWHCKPPYVVRRHLLDTPPIIAKDRRSKPRMPGLALKQALLLRDCHHCRFCGVPVIRSEIRKALRKLYADALYWTTDRAKPEGQHAALQALEAHYDHLLPHSRGGESVLENMVIACAPCNYGRDCWTVEGVGLADPRLREPIPSGWDGLERLLRR